MIDAHQHFWQLTQPFNYRWLDAPALAPIRRDFLPHDLLPHLRACDIQESIFVQTQHDVEENRWVLKLADKYDFIAGVVGWIDLANESCEEQLLEYATHPKFVGIRHVTQDEPDDDFIIRPEILRGLRILEKHRMPFDLLFYVKHLHHVPRLARELPELRMVIDHLAKPRIKDGSMDAWLPHLREAARFPHVYCKLSGLVTEADWHRWTVDDLKPYVDAALEAFGPNRCMYGSDWPVCLLAAPYEEVFSTLPELLMNLTPCEQEAIFGGTARRFYDLD